MEKEVKLVKKVKRLLKRLGCPRWLHYFGPKTYEFYEHLVALLVRSFCRLSYRRVKGLLDLLGIHCASKSALQYTSERIPKWMWDKILLVTSGIKHHLVALDSTGISRTNPSYHYLRRIDGKMPKVSVKLNVAFDTWRKKFCAAKIRVLPRHDSKDARYLLGKSNPDIAVADKAYNSEWFYSYSYDNGILLMSPKKKNARKGYYRKKMQKQFRTRTYNRRQLVESGFGGLKRTEGSSVSSKKAKTIRAELYCKIVTYNLFYCLFRLLGQSPIKRKFYIALMTYKL